MSDNKVRVALAANTLLYLPVYLLAESGRRVGKKIEIVQTELGDFGAYDAIRGGAADLCVCDPMTVARQWINTTESETKGVIVGTLAHRTGLWALVTPRSRITLPKSRPYHESFSRAKPLKVHNILTYSDDSTGGVVVRECLNHLKIWQGDYHEIDFGKELEELAKPRKVTCGEHPMDLVVTCDLLGVIAAEKRANRLWPGQREPEILVRFSEYGKFHEMLFTVLVASRQFAAEKEEVLIDLLEDLQEQVSRLYSTHVSDHNAMARLIAKNKVLHPTVGPGRDIEASIEEVEAFARIALEQLQRADLIPRSIRTDQENVRRGWEIAFEIWRLDHPRRAAEAFDACVDGRFALEATSRGMRRFARRLKKWLVDRKLSARERFLQFLARFVILEASLAFLLVAFPEAKDALRWCALVGAVALGVISLIYQSSKAAS